MIVARTAADRQLLVYLITMFCVFKMLRLRGLVYPEKTQQHVNADFPHLWLCCVGNVLGKWFKHALSSLIVS